MHSFKLKSSYHRCIKNQIKHDLLTDGQTFLTPILHSAMVAAHLRTFLKECGSFVHTIFPGKHYHLRTQFSQVNVTFAHIRFSQVTGMFALARLHRQAKPSFPAKAQDTSCLMVHIFDTQTGID